jgi:hypothetical protein
MFVQFVQLATGTYVDVENVLFEIPVAVALVVALMLKH